MNNFAIQLHYDFNSFVLSTLNKLSFLEESCYLVSRWVSVFYLCFSIKVSNWLVRALRCARGKDSTSIQLYQYWTLVKTEQPGLLQFIFLHCVPSMREYFTVIVSMLNLNWFSMSHKILLLIFRRDGADA